MEESIVRAARLAAAEPAPGSSQAARAEGWEQASAAALRARGHRFVEVAGELIASQGLEGLTLRAVLERAGLSRRAFYERFVGKEELILAVFRRTLEDVAAGYRRELEAIEEPLERLHFVIESMVRGARSDAGVRHAVAMSREHLRLAEARPDELAEALEPLTALIEEQLALGMQKGVVRAGDPRELAVLVHSLVAATIHASLLGQSARGAGGVESLWEFCLRAVRA